MSGVRYGCVVRRARAAITALVATSTGCSFRDLSSLGPPIDGGPAAEATVSGGCPGRAGPPGVRVGAFCIDRTEVTNSEYEAFLSSAPAVAAQPASCAANTSFEPRPSPSWPGPPTAAVLNIDWSDAAAYCAWAGKRLCGRIGGGGNVPRAEVDDASRDEWFFACSGGGERAFPYGASYVRGRCNDSEVARPVGGSPGCEGGAPGVFDLSGGVWEWVDACEGDRCALRGGSFSHEGVGLGCAFGPVGFTERRTEAVGDVGIRCCASP